MLPLSYRGSNLHGEERLGEADEHRQDVVRISGTTGTTTSEAAQKRQESFETGPLASAAAALGQALGD